MRKIVLIAICGIVLTCGPAAALDTEFSRFDLDLAAVQASGSDMLRSGNVSAEDDEFEVDYSGDKGIYKYEYKSPKKAFLYSLLIPGWGQTYAKSSIIKPILFLAVEVGSWAGYVKWHGDGNDLTDEFQRYADLNWIEGDTSEADFTDPDNPIYPNLEPQSYRGDLLDQYSTVDDDSLDFTHTLPDTRTQQYYEMIGKYDQFVTGWIGFWDDTTNVLPEMRVTYENMRKKANDKLDDANTMILVSMLNHLISAFDAALAANRFNKQQAGDTWSIKAEMKRYSATGSIPVLTVTRTF